MKLDLTKIVLVAVILSLSLFGVRQCSTKNTYRKAYNEKLAECAINESKILDYQKAKQAKIRDSINYYRQVAETYYQSAKQKNAIISSYKARIATLSDSISKLSPEESIQYIDANFVPGGEDYEITGDQIISIHLSDVKRKECESVVLDQANVIEYLDNAVKECMSGYDLSSKSLTACETSNTKKDIEIKELKRKNRNRTVFGVAMGALAVIAVL